jgi:hypothetical protein
MCYRSCEVNVTQALSADFRRDDFYFTALTRLTAMLSALILATQALVIFGWAEYFGAEETIMLWLEGSIVNCLGLANLSPRPTPFLNRSPDQVRVGE